MLKHLQNMKGNSIPHAPPLNSSTGSNVKFCPIVLRPKDSHFKPGEILVYCRIIHLKTVAVDREKTPRENDALSGAGSEPTGYILLTTLSVNFQVKASYIYRQKLETFGRPKRFRVSCPPTAAGAGISCRSRPRDPCCAGSVSRAVSVRRSQ